jgi:hypothetical protein
MVEVFMFFKNYFFKSLIAIVSVLIIFLLIYSGINLLIDDLEIRLVLGYFGFIPLWKYTLIAITAFLASIIIVVFNLSLWMPKIIYWFMPKNIEEKRTIKTAKRKAALQAKLEKLK